MSDWRDEIDRYLETTSPNEGCGIVLDQNGARRVVPLKNVYDRYHARDPVTYPRTSATAYLFDMMELQRTLDAAEAAGERLAIIFHSDCDVGSYFSAEDKAMAAPDGQPLYPGVDYLVVAVDAGKATARKLFVFEGDGFVEKALD